ncbi:CDP-2,3-bis-(O-geranylgeranyl)-sn-glycerol synthase [Candidatus Micrarchaeota archaeon]|nr:CDP-2,3-bis-(O-geranylgeranyl)-sn-glycerol synthase [Candidatus Micrarchaeota archaeon]
MDFISLVLFLIPVYVANAVPVILGGGTPLDFGAKWNDGRRIFGDSKTVRGFFAGVFGGTLAGMIIAQFYLLPFFATVQLQVLGAFMLSLGTMSGDALGSFVKRRSGVGSGKPFFLDSIMFILFALAFVYPFAQLTLYEPLNIIFFLLLTALLHPLTNFIANRAGLKNVPW